MRQTLTLARALDEHHKKGGARPSNILFPLARPASAAFAALKDAVAAAEPLTPYDESAGETIMVSDASASAVAAFLVQDGRLVALYSKPLTEIQARWPAFD